ncbi:MAG: 1-phosphofructokinase [Propionibacteriaceae bacterium]|nr:1-phosphofructokinase [Propionibacteriaceae bacterium]
MIVTLTANPGLDRTATLAEPLAHGGVNRVTSVTVEPGGKGINVARVIHAAGHPVRAILPAGHRDPILALLDRIALPYRSVPLPDEVRVNITLTEQDGTTTKINEPGPTLSAEAIDQLAHLLVLESEHADWVVLSGSLPPGVPTDWYADLVRALRPWGCKIAVDTSDAPLLALVDQFPAAAPDLLKPNSEELAQLTGADAEELEASAKAGDPSKCVAAARTLLDRGVRAVMATLGGSGAVLVTAEGAWHASPPPITLRSTVGAGDSSVAGYVLAHTRGASAPDLLRTAVAYGSAAASLAGTALPRPDQLNVGGVTIVAVA